MKNTVKKLSVPYNNDFRGTAGLLIKYKEHISEVYFPINPQILGSGRGAIDHEYYDDIIKALIGIAKNNDIKTNMIINQIGGSEFFADDKFLKRVLDYVDYFCNVQGVNFVTVTNPILAKNISRVTSYAKVVASVNMFINSFVGINKAMQLGISEFYLDRESNYNIDFIKKVKDNFKNIKMRIMLNEGCIPNCLFRQSHFDCVGLMQSQESEQKLRKYEEMHRISGCQISYSNDLSLLLKTPIIRPEDLKYYTPYIDTFKVVGRTTSTFINEMRIKAYSEEIFNGDFILLNDNGVARQVMEKKGLKIANERFPLDYAEKRFMCEGFCSDCNYCNGLVDELIEKEEKSKRSTQLGDINILK